MTPGPRSESLGGGAGEVPRAFILCRYHRQFIQAVGMLSRQLSLKGIRCSACRLEESPDHD